MGAVVSNNGVLPSLDAVAAGTYGTRMTDIMGEKVWDEPTDTTATFAVRVVNIPNKPENLDVEIWFRPYYIFETGDGNQVIIYDDVVKESYNSAYAKSAA
jgi:hypothetical protein